MTTRVQTMRVRDLPEAERPVNGLRDAGPVALFDGEAVSLLAADWPRDRAGPGGLRAVNGPEGLARADDHVLNEAPGIGPAQVARILAAIELGRQLIADTGEDRLQIRGPSDEAYMLMTHIGHWEQECFVVIHLDTRNRVIDKKILYQGTLNSSLVMPRRCSAGQCDGTARRSWWRTTIPAGIQAPRRRIWRRRGSWWRQGSGSKWTY